MKKSSHIANLPCAEIEEIEKMYSDQTMLTYFLMGVSVMAFSILIVLAP